MKLLEKIGGVLGVVAPTVATALGGPLAGVAVKALTEGLGLSDGDEEGLAAAISAARPEDLARIREIDAKFKADMANAGVELERIAASDRASARAREARTGDHTPKVLATIIFGGFFGVLGAMMFVEIPAGAETVLNVMLGALATMVVQVGNYYFGSSAGSAEKAKTIEKLKGGA